MTESLSRFQQVLLKLKSNGCRITPQRLAVLKYLTETQAHPTVETIYEKVKQDFPTTSLATVYKTIGLAKDLGEVLEIGFAGGSSRYDGYNPHPHPHLICLSCKKIMDPELAALKDITHELSSETGFKIVSHRLDFFGLCPECQKNPSPSARPPAPAPSFSPSLG